MARRIIKKEPQPVGYVLIADGETEQWYVELMKKHYDLRVKFHPELSHSLKISEQYDLVKELIVEGYEHVFWVIDFDSIQKENNEAKNNSALQKFKDVYFTAISKVEKDPKWKDRLTIIINNPCFEYWFYLHQHPESNRYFAQYETDLLPTLRKFDVGGGLFGRYNKKEHNYIGKPDLFEKLLPYLKNIDFKRLRPFNFQTCQSEGVSEMHKLFEVLNISLKKDGQN